MATDQDETPVFTTAIPIRMTEELAAEVEAYRYAQPGGKALARSQAVRALIALGLASVKQQAAQARAERRKGSA